GSMDDARGEQVQEWLLKMPPELAASGVRELYQQLADKTPELRDWVDQQMLALVRRMPPAVAAVFLALIDPAKAAEILKALYPKNLNSTAWIIDAMLADADGPSAIQAAAILTGISDDNHVAEIIKRLRFTSAGTALSLMDESVAIDKTLQLNAQELAPILGHMEDVDRAATLVASLDDGTIADIYMFAGYSVDIIESLMTLRGGSNNALERVLTTTIDRDLGLITQNDVDSLTTTMAVQLPNGQWIDSPGEVINGQSVFIATITKSLDGFLNQGPRRVMAVEVNGQLQYRFADENGEMIADVAVVYRGDGKWGALPLSDAAVSDYTLQLMQSATPAEGTTIALQTGETLADFIATAQSASTIQYNNNPFALVGEIYQPPGTFTTPTGPLPLDNTWAPNPLTDIRASIANLDPASATLDQALALLSAIGSLSEDQARYLHTEEKIAVLKVLDALEISATGKALHYLSIGLGTNDNIDAYAASLPPDIAILFKDQKDAIFNQLQAQGIIDQLKNWASIDIDEKANILNKVIDIVAQIYDLQGLNFQVIANRYLIMADGTRAAAAYFSEENIIQITLNAIDSMEPVKAVSNIIHEMTHAWQYSLVKKLNGNVLPNTDTWYEFALLLRASYSDLNSSNESGHYRYRWHEVHAYAIGDGISVMTADILNIGYYSDKNGLINYYQPSIVNNTDVTLQQTLDDLAKGDYNAAYAYITNSSYEKGAELLLQAYQDFDAKVAANILVQAPLQKSINIVASYISSTARVDILLAALNQSPAKLANIMTAIGTGVPDIGGDILLDVIQLSKNSEGEPNIDAAAKIIEFTATFPEPGIQLLSWLNASQWHSSGQQPLTNAYSLVIMQKLLNANISNQLNVMAAGLLLNELFQTQQQQVQAFLASLSSDQQTAINSYQTNAVAFYADGAPVLAKEILAALPLDFATTQMLDAQKSGDTKRQQAAYRLLLGDDRAHSTNIAVAMSKQSSNTTADFIYGALLSSNDLFNDRTTAATWLLNMTSTKVSTILKRLTSLSGSNAMSQVLVQAMQSLLGPGQVLDNKIVQAAL
ncbi:MAG: hypothetical protein AAFZ92_09315, partial [Pseudomonadota bacterium]